MFSKTFVQNIATTAAIGVLVTGITFGMTGSGEPLQSVIVQGPSFAMVTQSVADARGTVTHEPDIINAVGVEMTQSRLDALRRVDGLRIHADAGLETIGGPKPDAEDVN